MGIARRKAGTVVRCPSCSGQVVVPNPSAEKTEKPQEPASPRPGAVPELFERSNFDELFDDAAGGKRSAARPATAAAPHPTPDEPQVLTDAPGAKPPEFDFDVEPVPLLTPNPAGQAEPLPYSRGSEGIVLSPRTATLLIVAVILGLALVFIVGMIVGSMLHGTPSTIPPTDEPPPAALIIPAPMFSD
jgi:hypothetical protein